jgi:hypothetical protein
MHKLNQVKLPVRSREVVYPYLSPGMSWNRSLHKDSLLGKGYQNLEKGLGCASLNNPVRGGMTLLKSWSSNVGISIDQRTRFRRKTHGHSRPFDWQKKRGCYIPCPFSSIFVNSKEIGIVDPHGPWEHPDRWFFPHPWSSGRVHKLDRSELLDLSQKNPTVVGSVKRCMRVKSSWIGGWKSRREAWPSGYRHSWNRKLRWHEVGNFPSENPGINRSHPSWEDAWWQSEHSGKVPKGKSSIEKSGIPWARSPYTSKLWSPESWQSEKHPL